MGVSKELPIILHALTGKHCVQPTRERIRYMEKDIRQIVITGGPCGGKSTAVGWIQTNLAKEGWKVLIVPETATEFITGGVAPWTCGSNLDYQKCQMALQLEKERLFRKAALTMPDDKILIVCDRGALDNKVYMNDEEFAAVLDEVGQNEVELLDRYDAVYHLVTAAKGAVEFYTTANNGARIETPEQAAAMDDKFIDAWTGHPHLRIIDNRGNFSEKLQHLIREITAFCGCPTMVDNRRKFLISYPDISKLMNMGKARKLEITKTYLRSPEDESIWLRKSGADGHYTYMEIIRRWPVSGERIELERRLTENEYLRLLLEANPAYKEVTKTRYCFAYNNNYFQIDFYPFWNTRAIAIVEQLKGFHQEIDFPEGIDVIRDVTDDPEYKNTKIASLF